MHDETYKRLFAFPRMVEDLLRGFVAGPRADDIDFSTLQKLSSEYVSGELLKRHGDAVWQVDNGGGRCDRWGRPASQFLRRRPSVGVRSPVPAGRSRVGPFLAPGHPVGGRAASRNPAGAPHAPHAAHPRRGAPPGAPMHDAAYKLLFSRPRMVRDLLDGFAARGWSDALDFDTLTPLSASFVGEDLRQRHADLVWRVRFRDEDWLYLVLLLEFQATVDPAMAVRMLAYTAMVLQRLVADGVLSEHGALPSILPVVLYNGPRRWTAPLEVADMFAAAAPHRPSQRYYVLDVRRAPGADLPADNLVSALVGLERARDASGLDAALRALGELVRASGDEHLRRAFGAWLRGRLGASGRLPAGADDPLARLEEAQTMLEETLGEWTREWLERGRAEGIEQGRDEGIERGRAEERALLCRQAARKFDGAAAEGLAAALAGVTDPERLGRVGEWIIECATAEDLIARVRRDHGSDG